MSNQHSSPFDDPSNPFQDPSITSALNANREDPSYHLEPDPSHEQRQRHDDFTDTSFQQYSSEAPDPFSAEQDQKVLVEDSPSSGLGGSSTSNTNSPSYDAREEALRRKERELAQREADLENRRRNQNRPMANNFPPCFPVMYLDIPAEIPLEHQSTVWWLYREWLLFELTLVINFIACLCLLFSHPESVTSAPADLGVALTEMFTHTAASFFLWYRPVYNAYMKEVSLYYCKLRIG